MPVTGGYTLAGLGGASLSRFRLWHLEFVEHSVHQSDGLVVPAVGAEPLFEDQGAADRGDDDRQGSGCRSVRLTATNSPAVQRLSL